MRSVVRWKLVPPTLRHTPLRSPDSLEISRVTNREFPLGTNLFQPDRGPYFHSGRPFATGVRHNHTVKGSVMRTRYPVFATLLLSAVPSVSFAQIVVPYRQPAGPVIARLDHVVPVATVTPPGDAFALANPKPGIDFVLGAATLDIRDPDHPMIVFAVRNGTESPIPPSSVHVQVGTVYARRDGSPAVNICGYTGRLSGLLDHHGSSGVANATVAPGATVTMALPVGASNCVVGRPNVPLGFLVHLTSDGQIPNLHDTTVRLRRALELQRSRAQQ